MNTLLLSILLIFILAFFLRNLVTKLRTKQSIRGKSVKLSISLITSTIIYVLFILRLTVLESSSLFEIKLPDYSSYAGLLFIIAGFVIGLLALYTMRNSWRVGIKNNQKTELVNRGIYCISRNPYFLSYAVLMAGYLLVFPSPIIFILYLILITVFHKMILEEEKYLETVHGETYKDYKKAVRRYI